MYARRFVINAETGMRVTHCWTVRTCLWRTHRSASGHEQAKREEKEAHVLLSANTGGLSDAERGAASQAEMIDLNRCLNRMAPFQNQIDTEIDVSNVFRERHCSECRAYPWIRDDFDSASDMRVFGLGTHRFGVCGLDFRGKTIAGIDEGETRRLSVGEIDQSYSRYGGGDEP